MGDDNEQNENLETSPSKVTSLKKKPGQKNLNLPIYERCNWLIHVYYVTGQYVRCKDLIAEQLQYSHGMCEYAVYVKALIKRQEGDIHESLDLFQAATLLNPHNVSNLKQVARSLYLLGKHNDAIEAYESALKLSPNDWEILHNQGVCYTYMENYNQAKLCLQRANTLQKHVRTFEQIAKVCMLENDIQGAIQVYKDGLQLSSDNSEFLSMLGLLHLKLNQTQKAFDYLGNSLTLDPRNSKTVLAAGSVIQDHGDFDVALLKYRVAAVAAPESAHLWNNIGMALFGQGKLVAAIACLKRATYLGPFEWRICYNLGLVHLTTEQYASAFHFLTAAINMKPDLACAYSLLAVTLSRLDDVDNAFAAFEKAIEIENDPMTQLNYAMILLKSGQREIAMSRFMLFEGSVELAKSGVDNDEEVDLELQERCAQLKEAIGL